MIYKNINILPCSYVPAVQSVIDNTKQNDYELYEVIATMGSISKYNFTYYTTVLAEDEGKVILTVGHIKFNSFAELRQYINDNLLHDEDESCNESTWDINRN